MKYLITLLLLSFTVVLTGCVQNVDPAVDDNLSITSGEVIETGMMEDGVLSGEETTQATENQIDRNRLENRYGYSTDGVSVFFQGTLMPEADVNSFTGHERWGYFFAQDKNYIYYNGKKLEGLSSSDTQFLKCFFLKNNSVVYRVGTQLVGADAPTFELISHDIYQDNCGRLPVYVKDKSYVYFDLDKIEGADVETFEIIHFTDVESYARDKDSVYYNGKIIQGVDIETFEILDFFHAQDKNHNYEFGKIVE